MIEVKCPKMPPSNYNGNQNQNVEDVNTLQTKTDIMLSSDQQKKKHKEKEREIPYNKQPGLEQKPKWTFIKNYVLQSIQNQIENMKKLSKKELK